MSYVEFCSKHGQYHGEYCGECVEDTKELLYESLNWLCDHKYVSEIKNKNKDMQLFCCDCGHYLKSKEDISLASRIRSTLKSVKF